MAMHEQKQRNMERTQIENDQLGRCKNKTVSDLLNKEATGGDNLT